MAELNEQERADLVAYLDGELAPEAKRAFEARLARDPDARAEAAALSKTWELLEYLPKPAASSNFTSRTLDRLSAMQLREPERVRPGGGRAWAAGAAWAAAVLLALGGGWGVGRWQSAERDARTAAALEDAAVHHLHAVEQIDLFANVDDLAFLRALDRPELFGDDADSDLE